MKQLTTSLTMFYVCIAFAAISYAQAPQAIPYQAVARDNTGNLIANQSISLRFSIHDLTVSGVVIYKETQSATTNALGLFSVNIGQGTPVTGSFSSIDWAVNAKFLQVEMDVTGGNAYIDMGTQQMMSVPYALYAEKSNVPNGTSIGNTLRWNGSKWVADSSLTNKGSNIGIGTSSPHSSAALEISSTSKGLLLPRMTTAQRDAMSNPATGLMIYNTDSNCIDVRTVSFWLSFCTGTCYPQPTQANAGPDQQNVANPVTMQGNTPAVGTASWTIISGSGGSFANSTNPTTQFTGTGGLYRLRWTISSVCGSSFDEVYVLYICPAGTANCNSVIADGCEINLSTDASNCGSCGNNCNTAFPNATGVCTAGTCVFGSCLTGFYNVDGNTANGCEYACTFTSSTDLPDNTFADVNCDGIDGDVAVAIFVATTGNNADPGTRALPKATINAGITAAVAGGKTHVYVSQGVYNERVVLSNGISVYGGYSSSNNWARSGAFIVTVISGTPVSGNMIGIQGTGIASSTVVDRLTVSTNNNSTAGGSNYGLHCISCTGLSITNNTITAGNAGSGGAGSIGTTGLNGNSASSGGAGSCDGNGAGASGGLGGSSSCVRTGGNGGIGGGTSGFGSLSGVTGSPGVGGTSGGTGGVTGDPGSPGINGNTGAGGTIGSNGAGGSGGTVTANFWISNSAAIGASGTQGNGGGGGGGGGSQSGTFVDEGFGNGGGGGGAGGCLGTGGISGMSGGGSFGIFLVSSTGVVITNNTITSSNGGNGGAGGTGGNGGSGGSGALGGTNCLGEVGKGGNGGNGGAGGNGGHGGGGAGGPSYSVYRSSTTVSVTGNTLIIGSGGSGGSSAGNPGTAGASGTVF